MKTFLAILFISAALSCFGQSKSLFILKADGYFQKQNYPNACANYRNALSDSIELTALVFPYQVQVTNQKLPKTSISVDSNATATLEQYIEHQIAWCYMEMHDYKNAENYLKKTSGEKAYPHDLYYYAGSLMNNEKYDEAITAFEEYMRSPRANEELLHSAGIRITGCHYAKEQAPRSVTIRLADTNVFNSGTANFATMFFNGDKSLMFSSARPGGVTIDDEQHSEYLLDLYHTELQSDSTWSKASNFGRPLCSAQHEAASAFNNNNVIFYTRWNDKNKENQSIYLARMLNMKFYEAFKLDSTVNYPGYKSIQPFVSMDGRTLYFSSNRPGGFGQMDLWKIAIDSSGNTIGEAVNLGPLVNSGQNEVTPFFHEISSTLFYASDGHGSIGGLDIYKAFYQKENGSYQAPQNLGLPVNSAKDDAYLIWDSKLNKGFLSSDREPCDGGSCYDIYEVTNEPIRITLSGYSYDKETDLTIPNCKLTIKDIRGEFAPFTLQTDRSGYYEMTLEYGQEIFIKCQKERYFADANTVNTRPFTQSVSITRDFFLTWIPQEEVEIKGIEYDFNSDKLRPESMIILDSLVEFLELNNNISMEINAHTDARGSDIYNLDLSQRRAKSCVDYMISKGIDPGRLKSQGYGESHPNTLKDPLTEETKTDANGQPILLTEEYIKQQTDKDLQEELHQRNRRTSFKVVNSTLD